MPGIPLGPFYTLDKTTDDAGSRNHRQVKILRGYRGDVRTFPTEVRCVDTTMNMSAYHVPVEHLPALEPYQVLAYNKEISLDGVRRPTEILNSTRRDNTRDLTSTSRMGWG